MTPTLTAGDVSGHNQMRCVQHKVQKMNTKALSSIELDFLRGYKTPNLQKVSKKSAEKTWYGLKCVFFNLTDIQAEHSYSLSEDSAPQSPALSVKMDQDSGRWCNFLISSSWFIFMFLGLFFLEDGTARINWVWVFISFVVISSLSDNQNSLIGLVLI